ncbi:MAG: sce7726 family protein [Methyloligella sp. ZOD6]
MRDLDVRLALRRKVLADHVRDQDTLVIDELGLAHGAARVDLAVVNGWLHGFEIKSDADTFRRLPSQVEAYGTVLDKVTLVVGGRHAHSAGSHIPEWWGIKVATAGPRGAIHFQEQRAPRLNLTVDALKVAGLLWRDEAVSILLKHHVPGVRSKNRQQLGCLLAEHLPLATLRQEVREALKARVGWRSDTPSA